MTRVAIVAASEELRSSLSAALGDSPEFEVVGAVATAAAVPESTEVILFARAKGESRSLAGRLGAEALVESVLTNREREILALLADGLANKQIAARLGISTNTVKTHLELLFEKLGVSSRAEAVASGVRRGLLLL
jgi:DNA-binding CsgD family transcriptional regulator